MTNHNQIVLTFSAYIKATTWLEWKEEGVGTNKRKAPYTPGTSCRASVNLPATWGVLARCGDRRGFVLHGDGLGVVDLDGCRHPETGVITAWAKEKIDDFGSYAEVSPSGTGVHIFAKGAPAGFANLTLPMPGEPLNGKRPQIEAFFDKHYCTVTGDKLPEAPSEIRSTPEAWARLAQRRTPARSAKADEGRNGAIYALACRLHAQGQSDDQIEAAVRAANVHGNVELHENFAQGALPEQEVAAVLRSARSQPKGVTDDRVAITLRAGRLHEQADAAEDALVAAKAPIYTQGGELVRSVIEVADAARGRKTSVACITPCDLPWLSRELSKEIRCVKFKADGTPVAADVPRQLTDAVLSSASTKFSELAGIIETPTLRPDGSLLSEPGYDPTTGLLLANPLAIPPVPDKPSKQEAEAALRTLDELFNEFPFANEASRSVALSCAVTPVVRGAMSFVPIHVATAPIAGTGKSYLFDIAAAITTGNYCPVLSAGAKEEETEKRLHGAVLSGQPLILIDNLNGTLRGDFLCQLATQNILEVRRLGSTGNVRVRNYATVFANGNNLEIEGDLVRRTVQCSLDPEMENPETRQFKGDPFRAVMSGRGKYVAAVLTVVRAHLVAGFPGTAQLTPFAGFDDWSRLVRAALVWLGRADPVLTQEALRAEDPATATLDVVMEVWADAIAKGALPDVPLTVKELTERNCEGFERELRAVTYAREFEPLNTVRVGKFFKRHQGRIRKGMRLTAEYDKVRKQQTWRLTGWREFIASRKDETPGTSGEVVSLAAGRQSGGRSATPRPKTREPAQSRNPWERY